jgi:glycosyltransferase 2 family protein
MNGWPSVAVKRWIRIGLTLLLTALAVAYLVWKIDVGETIDTLLDASPWWFALSAGIMIGTALPMALRWQWLMRAQGMDDSFAWLTRAYFVSYTASQVLPTSIGGDAMRVYETARRHPGRTGDVTGIILLERGLGGAGTVLLGAIGFLLAVGRYDVGAYLWLEGLFVLGTLVLLFLFFARSARPLLARAQPLLRRFKLERPLRALYDGIHHFRGHVRLLVVVFIFTTAIQAVRILAIWAGGRAVGIDLGPRIYYVMGPLFFLVLLVPFTLNGIAVREAFFVSFLGSVGVAADAAFAAGFLFFLVTTALALPGAAILLWEGVRGRSRPRLEHG